MTFLNVAFDIFMPEIIPKAMVLNHFKALRCVLFFVNTNIHSISFPVVMDLS
jgi:hypothetical protein